MPIEKERTQLCCHQVQMMPTGVDGCILPPVNFDSIGTGALMITYPGTRIHLRTANRFAAEDPWNQNRPTTFTIEAYRIFLSSSGITKPSQLDFYGIRSELDGRERMLPDSLCELYYRKQIRAESLPRLLKEIEPQLDPQKDANPFVRWKVVSIGVRMFLLAPSVFLIAIPFRPAEIGSDQWWQGFALMFLAFECLFCLFTLTYLVRRSRFKRQMKWALSRA
jgi:hypothetical protein